jgi:hypothetical protein
MHRASASELRQQVGARRSLLQSVWWAGVLAGGLTVLFALAGTWVPAGRLAGRYVGGLAGLTEERRDAYAATTARTETRLRFAGIATEFHAACLESDPTGAVAAAQEWDAALADIQARAPRIGERPLGQG